MKTDDDPKASAPQHQWKTADGKKGGVRARSGEPNDSCSARRRNAFSLDWARTYPFTEYCYACSHQQQASRLPRVCEDRRADRISGGEFDAWQPMKIAFERHVPQTAKKYSRANGTRPHRCECSRWWPTLTPRPTLGHWRKTATHKPAC
jgi:hypothetical protein